MKRLYSLLLVLLALTSRPGAQAQVTAWRPFRPGLVYAFRTARADSIFTLRVDSVYAAGPDSVYRFNRTLRVLRGNRYVPTSNNLFGARMQFRPGTGNYTLVLDANVPGAARQWTLQSATAVGESYDQPVGAGPPSTATVLSKEEREILPGLRDEVLTLRTQPDADSLVFSRRYGAVQLPRSLYGSMRGSRPLYLAELPVPISQSRYYAPTVLFDYQPGDEFGFKAYDGLFTAFPCSEGFRLRRILTRQQTADSLLYTYLEQSRSRTLSVGAPGCATTASSTVSPVETRRLAISLRTGRSPQIPYLGVFTAEYAVLSRDQLGISGVAAGLPITPRPAGGCGSPSVGATYLYRRLADSSGPTGFGVIADAGCQPFTGVGVGQISTCAEYLTCYRRQLPNGQRSECGTCGDFSTLLPARPAQAAAVALLYPNPATSAATLTLAAPARAGTTLALLDALGRRVWSVPVTTSQTALRVPLAGRPAGLYLVQLAAPGAAPRTWRLQVI